MAFKMSGYSAFTKTDDKKYTNKQVEEALNNWKSSEKISEDYRINQLNDDGGSKSRFNELDSITKSKRSIYENLKNNSNFKPNKRKNNG